MKDTPRVDCLANQLAPVLRWAGSKRKLLPDLIRHIPREFNRYVEPFSGSACLFFALRPPDAILADLSTDLIETYRTIRAHPRLVHGAAASMPNTAEHYYWLRDEAPRVGGIADAARFVYLNRHSFNGVYRTNRQGQFNVPRGERGGSLPCASHFTRCANALKRADLVAADFAEVISMARAGDFVYLDPPYAKRGSRRRGEYGYASFDTSDLVRLSKGLVELNKKNAVFLLSYAYCQEIQSIARRWNTKTVLVRRHVAGFDKHRARVREILISNRTFSAPAPKSL